MFVLAVWKQAAQEWPTHGYLWPVSLLCTEALFLMKYKQKGIQRDTGAELVIFEPAASWARTAEDCAARRLLFNTRMGCGLRKYMAGEESCRYLCKSTLGHPEVACKKSAVAFGSRKGIFSVNVSTALLQSMGKFTVDEGTWRTESDCLLACTDCT